MNEEEIKYPARKRHYFVRWMKNLLLATEAKQAIKTGLAASISLAAGLAFAHIYERPDTLVSGLWCVMASIVVMQAHLGGTYKAAWIRFLGVLIGSIAGAVLIDQLGSSPLSLGISVFFTIVICSLMNIKDSFRIAAMSTAVIIVMGATHPINPWVFSFYRFIDSCIGILVALVIARLLWPEKATENIRKTIAKTLNLLSKYFRLAVDLEPEKQNASTTVAPLFDEIVDLLDENRDYRDEAQIELFDKVALREHWSLITDQLETLFECVDNLKHVHKETISKILDDGLANQLNVVIEKTEQAFETLEKMILLEPPSSDLSGLDQSIKALGGELLRFRGTRTTRKFNLEDVESFFVFFYNVRSIAEALIKLESQIKKLAEIQ